MLRARGVGTGQPVAAALAFGHSVHRPKCHPIGPKPVVQSFDPGPAATPHLKRLCRLELLAGAGCAAGHLFLRGGLARPGRRCAVAPIAPPHDSSRRQPPLGLDPPPRLVIVNGSVMYDSAVHVGPHGWVTGTARNAVGRQFIRCQKAARHKVLQCWSQFLHIYTRLTQPEGTTRCLGQPMACGAAGARLLALVLLACSFSPGCGARGALLRGGLDASTSAEALAQQHRVLLGTDASQGPDAQRGVSAKDAGAWALNPSRPVPMPRQVSRVSGRAVATAAPVYGWQSNAAGRMNAPIVDTQRWVAGASATPPYTAPQPAQYAYGVYGGARQFG